MRSIDVPDLVGQCEIDHMVGPVPHTVGGSVAGYQRWERFRRAGLSAYARRRNDPLADGVSRMSAYLHYGMVSPLRIAREAAEQQADKFLDELLIWRELAHNLCFHRDDHACLSVLPGWARDTLWAHATDARPAILSWERLARGQTGDALWDAAQTSLLIHGELHNNVRMTWGKALLQWTAEPETALAMMVDLNHRYALDGRDPCSYGGLLWCLGLFDRPFPPPRPIYGAVRERPTAQHASRLDIAAYRRQASRPLREPILRVAVIGAGISGLTCARTLADHGVLVNVFEKSRGVGGRMATRRSENGVAFDHGAQYFTIRDQRFQRYADVWLRDGLVQPWKGRVVSLRDGKIESEKESTLRFVAAPGMNAIGKHLATGLQLAANTHVTAPTRCGDKWLVSDDAGRDLGQYDVVVVSAPAPQASQLLAGNPELSRRTASVKTAGCWAVLVQFASRIAVDYDGAFVQNSPLSWIARNSSKPGRNSAEETWILHATGDWSESHIDEPPDGIPTQLLSAFWKATGAPSLPPCFVAAHRWRYALPTEPLRDRCLFDRDLRIGACGDWCCGPRVEGAFLSGAAMAGRVLGLLTEPLLQDGTFVG
jgi:predicted NAD/FAD-dependent oxidoreductase